MTNFDKIIDVALAVVDDYKIGRAYNQSIENFQAYCDGFLMQAVPQFVECRQSLDYDIDERAFNADLTVLEQYILSRYWVIAWWERETNNSAQIALKLGLKNQYSYNSESQNFKEKQNIIDKLREEVDRATQDYLLLDLDTYDF